MLAGLKTEHNPMATARRIAWLTLGVMGPAVFAAAQETAPASPPVAPKSEAAAGTEPGSAKGYLGPPSWTVQVEPWVWWVSPSGKVRLPATSGSGGSGGGGFPDSGDKVRVEDLNLDTPRLSPAGRLHANAENFRFTFTGGIDQVSRDRTIADSAFRLGSVAVAPGDALNVDFHLAAFETTLGYQVWGRDFADRSSEPASAVQTDLRLYAFGGARFTDFSLDVKRLSGAPGAAGADEFYVEPIVGLRLEAELGGAFSIGVEVSGGYYADSDRSIWSIDVAAAFTWRPCPNVGIQIGWRQLAESLTDGDDGAETERFEYDGRLAGVFAGVMIRF